MSAAAVWGVDAAASLWVSIDDAVRGHRLQMLCGCAFLVWLSSFWPGVYLVALPTYAFVIWGMGVARVWAIRDDDGRWTLSYLMTRVRAAARLGLSDGAVLDELVQSLPTYALTLGATAFVLAEPLALVADLTNWVDGGAIRKAGSIGLLAVAVVVGAWILRWLRSDSAGAERTRRALAELGDSTTWTSITPIVDLFDLDERELTGMRGLRPIAVALKAWKPRGCTTEADFERSLCRHLRRSLDAIDVDSQVAVRDARGRRVGQADVVVGSRILFELKVKVQGSAADRAVGQVWKYAENWTAGPVILLLCETARDFVHEAWLQRVEQLRAHGRPVMVMAAGRRLR